MLRLLCCARGQSFRVQVQTVARARRYAANGRVLVYCLLAQQRIPIWLLAANGQWSVVDAPNRLARLTRVVENRNTPPSRGCVTALTRCTPGLLRVKTVSGKFAAQRVWGRCRAAENTRLWFDVTICQRCWLLTGLQHQLTRSKLSLTAGCH